jgi:hypothetical protein
MLYSTQVQEERHISPFVSNPAQNVKDVFLSVVIPAFNEEARLPSTLEHLLHYFGSQAYTVEVIVINDGSVDSTSDVVKAFQAQCPYLRLVNMAKNQGKGAALQAGFKVAKGRYALMYDADRAVPIDTIEDWLNAVKASRVALTSLIVIVSQNGKPLRDVTVKLVPEDFMGGGMKVAEGTTDTGGGTMLAIPGSPYPGVNCGLYRVEITGSGANGRPIPARYNAETTLGAAVGGVLPDGGTLKFELEGP